VVRPVRPIVGDEGRGAVRAAGRADQVAGLEALVKGDVTAILAAVAVKHAPRPAGERDRLNNHLAIAASVDPGGCWHRHDGGSGDAHHA